MKEPIRIISDVHLGHPASLVTSADQLRPLFRGAGTVVFNGDSVEMRLKGRLKQAELDLEALRAACEAEGADAVFINGNHDPVTGPLNHLDLCDRAVLVTHGDVIYHDISPWSLKAEELRDASSRELAKLDHAATNDFEERLAASKRAAMAVEMPMPRKRKGTIPRLAGFVGELWPPRRPLMIFKVWLETPGRAVAMAKNFRPHARYILIGHVHSCGLWQIPPRWVINTGSFLPWLGRFVAEIDGPILSLRRVKQARDGTFFSSPPIAEFDAGPLRPDEEC